jgi:hypothetical protein
VGGDTLRFESTGSNVLTVRGEIACWRPIVVRVEEHLEVLEGEGWNAYVQTYEYSYNASVRGHGNILRYDNVHSFPGHPDANHKHEFDWRTGEELPGFPEWTGRDERPTLGEVMEEVERQYWNNLDDLPEPDKYPKLGLRS